MLWVAGEWARCCACSETSSANLTAAALLPTRLATVLSVKLEPMLVLGVEPRLEVRAVRLAVCRLLWR